MLVILDYASSSVHVFATNMTGDTEITEEILKRYYPEFKESQCCWMWKSGDKIDVTFHGNVEIEEC